VEPSRVGAIERMLWRIVFIVGPSFLLSFTSAFSNSQAHCKSCGRQKPQYNFRSRLSPLVLDAVKKDTVQDESVSSPASLLFYDDVLDDSIPDGVVCARGVCVLQDFGEDEIIEDDTEKSILDKILGSYLGPRLILACASILYGTNFPLGSMMNEALTPSATTSSRMLLASISLSPFLFKLTPEFRGSALLSGCFVALGYISQSLALIDVSPATVAFLGAATVIVCPALEAIIDKKPMGLKDAPQVWLAASLCISGVGILELYDPSGNGDLEFGFCDIVALLQSVGFGTSFFITERMMRRQPDQALPITAVQVSVTAFLSMIWCFADGWIGQPGTEAYSLPNLFFEPTLAMTAAIVVWTGFITTALNRVLETISLGRVQPAEASVILATEPLWAAVFAALLLSENFGANDYIGGTLIVLACLANSLKPSDFSQFWEESD